VSADLRILLLADSHLGFDLPARPRVQRRRRGHDFLANYAAALQPALDGEIDAVVHGGDVFNRSVVAPTVAYQALEPLRRIADLGIPVFIVPGNHERSRLPHVRFAAHPNVHIFDNARTFVAPIRGTRLALSGFPYERHEVRTRFGELLQQTGWREHSATLRALCIHHCVEGATVGPADFVFTTASDVIRTRELPPDFAAVLSGHIHRHQVLKTDLYNRPIESTVLYPGSIERTSLAEIGEPKGFLVVRLRESEGDQRVDWEFRRLPARPMMRKEVAADQMPWKTLEAVIDEIILAAPADAVLSIRITGHLTEAHWRAMSEARLRAIMPETMNVEIRPLEGYDSPRRRNRHQVVIGDSASQLSFC
jgi:DNA repair protein SbcD/Mre11